jgi:hypothetical protein
MGRLAETGPGEPVSFDVAAPRSRRAMKPDNRPPDTKRRQSIQPAKVTPPRLQVFGIMAVSKARGSACLRQAVAGNRPSSASSCSRTGSRSPSIASRKTERANSSGFTVVCRLSDPVVRIMSCVRKGAVVFLQNV